MIFQETETSELKRVLNDTLPKEIDAFLNSFDGNIYIGVEDDGMVIGVENLEAYCRYYHHANFTESARIRYARNAVR